MQQLRSNSCADHLDLSICNQSRPDLHQSQGGGSSDQAAADHRGGSCSTSGPQSRVSVARSDLLMITADSQKTSPTRGACSIGTWSNPSSDLNESFHGSLHRRDDFLISSRQQPRMLFSSSSCAADDNERSGWSPRCYACSFCGREFNSAQALGGHMNIHRRDRALLRTSTSPASIPHDLQADLFQGSPPSGLYDYFNNETAFRDSTISSSLNVPYAAPSGLISAPLPFGLLDMHQPAADSALLTNFAALPSQGEKPADQCTSVPLGDLKPNSGSTRRPTSATRFSKVRREAHSLSSNIAPHGSPLFVRPSLQDSYLKHVEPLDVGPEQAASASRQAQLNQLSHSQQRIKRPRQDADAVDKLAATSTATQRCRQEEPSVQKSNLVHAACSCVSPTTASGVASLLCLDLELRLGQSWQSDSA